MKTSSNGGIIILENEKRKKKAEGDKSEECFRVPVTRKCSCESDFAGGIIKAPLGGYNCIAAIHLHLLQKVKVKRR